jgi:hypothetical protein
MLPGEAEKNITSWLKVIDRHVPDRVIGCYGVGSLALGDFAPRRSNLDLVAVTDQALTEDERRQTTRVERELHRGLRAPRVAWVTAVDLAGGTVPGKETSEETPALTPMTRSILASGPVTFRGPERPVGAVDRTAVAAWFARGLPTLAVAPGVRSGRSGTLFRRPTLTEVILEVTRHYRGAVTGHVVSKQEAGEHLVPFLPSPLARVLRDALGWHAGGRTSMYWGPIERRTHARSLIAELATPAPVALA